MLFGMCYSINFNYWLFKLFFWLLHHAHYTMKCLKCINHELWLRKDYSLWIFVLGKALWRLWWIPSSSYPTLMVKFKKVVRKGAKFSFWSMILWPWGSFYGSIWLCFTLSLRKCLERGDQLHLMWMYNKNIEQEES